MPRKKSPSPIKATSEPLTSLSSTALMPVFGSEGALVKMPGSGGTVSREPGATMVAGRSYATRDRTIPDAEIYFVDGAKPSHDGPWLGEADKVAWRDEATGYECIMLRASQGGYLSGYVGVPEGHPLWGWEHQAIPPDIGIQVHGGLTYSRVCEDGPSPARRIITEARRICHVPPSRVRHAPVTHATDYRVDDAHAWWFGFDCNHIYDLIPGADRDRQQFLGAEVGGQYRDDTYVVREILNLAAQLRAIADGEPAPPRMGPPLPPIGLDPSKGG